MAMSMPRVRICANACITRLERGEPDVIVILDSYPLAEDDRNLVLAEIYSKRPDLAADPVPEQPKDQV
ncbi:hypothetical protein [Paenibacillus polymyxa]|uniref:Uncharacterized protein n=1 Tax=Paenibacillus polymyxa TaxID=1406 RepID=A0AAP4A2Z8_PAEPO|nr:hypothetical protein [Paenibacillus polymyxa]MDH2334297.1 hypothetical protein [Paenibacillus polymyxa]